MSFPRCNCLVLALLLVIATWVEPGCREDSHVFTYDDVA